MLGVSTAAKREVFGSDRVADKGPPAKAIQRWMRACGRIDPTAFESNRDLYGSWVRWCESTEESRPCGVQLFSAALRGILVKRRKHHAGRGFVGFRTQKRRRRRMTDKQRPPAVNRGPKLDDNSVLANASSSKQTPSRQDAVDIASGGGGNRLPVLAAENSEGARGRSGRGQDGGGARH